MLFAWLCLLFPLIGVLLTPVFASLHPTLRDYGPVFFSFLTAVSALMLLPFLFHDPTQLPMEEMYVWLSTPMQLSFGILLDPLSIVVTNVVAVISFFIMVYCLGYMKGNPSIMRFWMLMNAFIGSMLLLVLANNLIIVFIGWKLVGVCSYGLISFYFRDEKKYWIGGPEPYEFDKPTVCGYKALVTTSVGDMLMLGGLLIMYHYSGILNVLELYQTAPEWIPVMAATPGMIILVSVLLIAGPVGKSAQFPLHEWLPEAMSGPGPVSALIHAATMVKSGVFFIARLIPIFYYGYWTAGVADAMYFFYIVAWIGAITAFLAASQGLVALELKKVLAYSTVSQIGLMMLALGVSGFSQDLLVKGYTAGIFHLVSHAMFKACLFLCAGTVIHAAHSIYIHEMGAMRKYLPYTWIFMGLAALSLIGVPPLPGFWSKEAVLIATLESEHYALFALAIATVVFTAFYTMRFLGMVFHGSASGHILKQGQKTGHHIGEGYRTQTFACGILAVGIVALGIMGLNAQHLLHDLFEMQLVQDLAMPAIDLVPKYPIILVIAFSIGGVVLGALPAYFFFVNNKWSIDSVFSRHTILSKVHTFLWERWYINKFYNWFFVSGTVRISSVVAPKEVRYDIIVNRQFPEGVKAFSSSVVADKLERDFDITVHRHLPEAISRKGNALINFIRADAKDLSSNIAYILTLTIILTILAVIRMI